MLAVVAVVAVLPVYVVVLDVVPVLPVYVVALVPVVVVVVLPVYVVALVLVALVLVVWVRVDVVVLVLVDVVVRCEVGDSLGWSLTVPHFEVLKGHPKKTDRTHVLPQEQHIRQLMERFPTRASSTTIFSVGVFMTAISHAVKSHTSLDIREAPALDGGHWT